MLYCKNTVQQGLPLTLDPRVLYRGLGMSIMNMSILTGLQFPLTGAVGKAIKGGADREMSTAEKIGAGFTGGAISGFVCAPVRARSRRWRAIAHPSSPTKARRAPPFCPTSQMELVMIQQQRFGSSLARAAGRIVSERGLLGLFRGLVTSCGREGLFASGYLALGPVFAQTLKEQYLLEGTLGDFTGASGAGVVAASLSHPLDTIKTCMQGDLAREKYGSMQGTTRVLYAEGGTASFFRGFAFRTVRMICAIYLIGRCKDFFAPRLFPPARREEEKASMH